jgi:hypothetical protein
MELKNMGITENEKMFREHLKKFYPNKYDMLIAMDQTKLEDNELKVSPT